MMSVVAIKTADAPSTARQRAREASYFHRVRRAELSYSIQLRKIANQVRELISAYADPSDPAAQAELQDILGRYSVLIRPWAAATASRMIAEVARRDEQAWMKHSRLISRNIRREIQQAPIGNVVRQIQEEQVGLITSIPIEAGRHVQELAREYLITGRRYTEMVPEIQKYIIGHTERYARNRATLIAHTETAKVHTALTQARAKFIGADQYVWRTARDKDVRPMHQKLEGTAHSWDNPPIAEENGQRHHPGEFPNCRCVAHPIIPEHI